MNKRRAISIILLMIFVFSSVLPVTSGYAATNEAISFDSALYAAVKSNLEKQSIQATYNDMQHTISISENEIAKVTKLTLSNSGITNLSGLEKFSKVTSLDLSANKLTDESDLSILNSFNLNFLDLSSNQLSDVSAITNIKGIATVNLHNQILDKVEVIDNSIVKEGTYKYQCELPQIIREFAKPIKADWIETKYTGDASLKFDVSSFNSNGDTIGLTIGNTNGDQFTGLATLKMKIGDMNNKLYNSEINVHYVVINEDQRAIFLKDKKLYDAVKAQLTSNQNINANLKTYTNSTNLFDKAYDEQQILVINQNNLVNKITSLVLTNKQLSDLSGLEMFVGLEQSLDVSSNYIKTIDTIVDLQKMKDEEEAKLQARFREKAGQLKERIATLEALETELDSVIKTYNEAVGKYNSYQASEDTNKAEKMLGQLEILRTQGKRFLELTGGALTIGSSWYTLSSIDNLTVVVDQQISEIRKPTSMTTGEIATTKEKVQEKSEEIYNVYNQVYKATSVITPALKNITDEEYANLTLEQAKILLQAQVTKINSIEKYFTSTEKTWVQTNFGIAYTDENKTALSAYFTEKLKDLEENPNVNSYKTELTKLRKFDTHVMWSSLYLIEEQMDGNLPHSIYQVTEKTLDGEDTSILNGSNDNVLTDEKILDYFSRIANASDEDIAAFITLPRLYRLNMSENLIENIDEISIMKELRELKMANNEISNINNVNWTEISWLNTLDLAFNNISNIKVLESVKKLKNLNVSKNLISGSLNFTINDINKLENLDLSENQIDDIENFKNQFEFIAKANNKNINEYVKETVAKKISLNGQNLSMDLSIEKSSDRVKIELPKIFRQLEEIDWENTSFGFTSLYGNVASDGTYVILETPAIGKRVATVTVTGTGIGTGTNCTIQYEVVNNGGNSGNQGNNNVQINVNIGTGSSVQATKQVNNMSYIVVAKDTTVSDILKDVTLNTDAYSLVIKDANAENIMNSTDKLKTNQTIIVNGLSDNAQCKIVVKGDVTGSGNIDLGDVLRLNEYRLDHTKKLTDAEFIAGNMMDTDDEIDMSDILGLNEYRLNQ